MQFQCLELNASQKKLATQFFLPLRFISSTKIWQF